MVSRSSHRQGPVSAALLWCGATLVLVLLFLYVPQIDIAVSALFGDAHGFPLANSPFLNGVRTVMFLLTDGVMVVAIVALIAALTRWGARRLDRQILALAVTAYALGPGLIVNLVLKGHAGRARPRQIEMFGGDKTFSPAFTLSDQCDRNCSFVSGEASALATVAVLALLFVVPRLPAAMRPIVATAILAVAVFGSGLRLAFGAHFLSDIVFAWLISIAVVFGLRAAFGIGQNRSGFAARSDVSLPPKSKEEPI